MNRELIPGSVGIPNDPFSLRERLFQQDPDLLRAARKIADWLADPAFADAYVPPYKKPRALIVGGFVRDSVLGLHPKDLDLEVYGLEPETLRFILECLFGAERINAVGASFGILKVALGDGRDLDVSIPRRESKSGKGHRGFTVSGDPSMPVTEAARRRDFTMNALAADPLTGEIIDPFGGIGDLRTGQLRVTDPERFQDDPLRVYRAVQFVARMELEIEPRSRVLMREMVERGDLEELAEERIAEEWKKLLLKAPRPSLGLEALRDLGIIERSYPELQALIGVPQEPEWHPEGDVWTHTLMVLDAAAQIVRRADWEGSPEETLSVLVGALCHDLGKPATTRFEEGRWRSRGHEEAGVEPAKRFLERVRFSKTIETCASASAAEHLKPGMLFRSLQQGTLDEAAYRNNVRRLLKRLETVPWPVLLAVSEADFRGRTLPGVATDPYLPGLTFAATVRRYQLDTDGRKPLVQGRDLLALGMNPGPRMGELLKHIERLRDEGRIQTREEALAEAAHWPA